MTRYTDTHMQAIWRCPFHFALWQFSHSPSRSPSPKPCNRLFWGCWQRQWAARALAHRGHGNTCDKRTHTNNLLRNFSLLLCFRFISFHTLEFIVLVRWITFSILSLSLIHIFFPLFSIVDGGGGRWKTYMSHRSYTCRSTTFARQPIVTRWTV